MLRQLCLLLLFSNCTLLANAQAVKWQDALQMDPASVNSLDCSGLKWDSLPAALFKFVWLDLKVGKNTLDHFPLVLCQLPSLAYLSLERNELRILPDQMSSLTQLQTLDLYGNAIEQVGEGIFLLPDLRVLNIEGVMYGTIFAKQLLARLPQTKVLIDPPCKCLD